MPGTWLAARVRPGLLQERRTAGIEVRRILGKSKEGWVRMESGQRELASTVREAMLRTELLWKVVH